MNYGTALDELGSMIAADVAPVLDEEELHKILNQGARADYLGNSIRNVATVDDYASAVAYNAGDLVKSGVRFWLCVYPGTSSGVTFPTSTLNGLPRQRGYIVQDGSSLLWEDHGTLWIPTYNLHAAASEGWRRKAGLVSNRFSFSTDGQTFTRDQWFSHCMQLSRSYDTKAAYTVRITRPGDRDDVG